MGFFVYIPLCRIRVHLVRLLDSVLAMLSLTAWLMMTARLPHCNRQAKSVLIWHVFHIVLHSLFVPIIIIKKPKAED